MAQVAQLMKLYHINSMLFNHGGYMFDYNFYSAILGLSDKWRIFNVTVDKPSGLIELHIRSNKESQFSCTCCGAMILPKKLSKSRWLHENSSNSRFYITAQIPVLYCHKCGEIKVIPPWKSSGILCEEQSEEPGQSSVEN